MQRGSRALSSRVVQGLKWGLKKACVGACAVMQARPSIAITASVMLREIAENTMGVSEVSRGLKDKTDKLY